MLFVARVSDRSGRYYLSDMAAEVGASSLVAREQAAMPAPGRWTGAAARGLGLSGPVGGAPLAAVLSGCHPHAEHRLRQRPGAVAGYDLVFAAPKSVSILFGLGGADHAGVAMAAHRAGVETAQAYLEERAIGVRVGTGEDRRTASVRGMVGAAFDHGVSRALDPHLHTHVVVANMAQGPDGRWRALDGRGLDAHARAASALYDAQLRHTLTERTGARWSRRTSGAYELASVDPAVLGALSGRQAEIRGLLHGSGLRAAAAPGSRDAGRGARTPPSARARAVAWASTRDAKATVAARTPAALRRRWLAAVGDVGWTPEDLSRSLGALGPPEPGTTLDEHRFATSLHAGTVHGGATRREVVAAWADAAASGVSGADVRDCIDQLARWDRAVGVAELPHQRAELLASPQALWALGPRPVRPGRLAVWQHAAAAVDRARARGVGQDVRTAPWHYPRLSPAGLARLTTEQLAAHLTATRAVADARRRLGLPTTSPERDAARSRGRA